MKIANTFLLLIITSISTSVSADDTDVLMMQGPNYVKLISQDMKGAPGNQHPYSISTGEICTLLSSIEIEKTEKTLLFFDKKTTKETIFNEKELGSICALLSKAFARADADQDVAFSASSMRPAPSGIGSNTLTTSARLFVSDNHLNVIFRHVHVDYNRLLDRESYGEKLPKSDYIPPSHFKINPVEPGSRVKKSRQKWELVASDETYYQSGRKDWVKIDIPEVLTAALASDSETNETQEAVKNNKPAVTRPASATVETAKKLTLEERLVKLKGLYEDGLISEEVYKRKMSDIVNEL